MKLEKHQTLQELAKAPFLPTEEEVLKRAAEIRANAKPGRYIDDPLGLRLAMGRGSRNGR